MTMKIYPVLRPIEHDQVLYDPIAKPGITLVMDEEIGDPLVDIGVLGEGAEAPAAVADDTEGAKGAKGAKA